MHFSETTATRAKILRESCMHLATAQAVASLDENHLRLRSPFSSGPQACSTVYEGCLGDSGRVLPILTDFFARCPLSYYAFSPSSRMAGHYSWVLSRTGHSVVARVCGQR